MPIAMPRPPATIPAPLTKTAGPAAGIPLPWV